MLTCGVPRSSTSNAVPPGLARDVARGRGRELHQALRRPARDDLAVAEVRLGVDDAGDERRVEALLARLLADDVLVAQRQADLVDRLVQRRARITAAAIAADQRRRARAARRAAGAPCAGARRRPGAGRRRDGGGVRLAAALIASPCSLSSTSDSASSSSSTVPLFATTNVARSRLLVLRSAGAPRARRRRAWPRARGALARGRPRRRRPRSSRRRRPPCPASNSSGVSTTAARGGGSRRATSSRRTPTTRCADPRPQQLLEPRALVGVGERAPRDRGAVDDAAGRDLVAPALARPRRAPRRSA